MEWRSVAFVECTLADCGAGERRVEVRNMDLYRSVSKTRNAIHDGMRSVGRVSTVVGKVHGRYLHPKCTAPVVDSSSMSLYVHRDRTDC